ncbi:MAG: hypothetical protein F6K47_35950 [Symploca sp. SIO2E6]|nr:hypothetical protein [Symploca sp. SIO2E6]
MPHNSENCCIVINQRINGLRDNINSLNLRLMAGGNIDINADINTGGGYFESESVNFNSEGFRIRTRGFVNTGNINIMTTQDIIAGGFRIERRNPSTAAITLNAGGAITVLDHIYTRVREGGEADGGRVSITANDDITITRIQSQNTTGIGDSGDINVLSHQGSITFNGPVSSGNPFEQIGNGGHITLIAPEGIFTQELISGVAEGNAGNITLITDSTIKINPGSLAGYLQYYFQTHCNDPCEGVGFNSDGSTTITKEFFDQFSDILILQQNGWSLTGDITIEGLTLPQPRIPEPIEPEPTSPANSPTLPPTRPNIIPDTTVPAPLTATPPDITATAPLPATPPNTTATATPQNISLQDFIDSAADGTGGTVALS